MERRKKRERSHEKRSRSKNRENSIPRNERREYRGPKGEGIDTHVFSALMGNPNPSNYSNPSDYKAQIVEVLTMAPNKLEEMASNWNQNMPSGQPMYSSIFFCNQYPIIFLNALMQIVFW